MQIIKTRSELRETLRTLRRERPDDQHALVPTMGYLHEGHLSLMRQGKQRAPVLAASIFVNPLQFNDPEDYARYPMNLDRDFELCESVGVDIVFVPERKEMFPDKTSVLEMALPALTHHMEGEFRPGHFEGVLLICARLFNLFQPDYAIFGRKDFQQLAVVKRMAQELDFALEVVPGETVREEDGLAMSSRNVRLGEVERQHAGLIHRGMKLAEKTFREGKNDPEEIREIVQDVIESGSRNNVEYIGIVDADSMEFLEDLSERDKFLIAVAIQCGSVRLIDNMECTR